MAQANAYYVYMLASKRNGTLYVGVTNDLIRRIQEHREGLVPGFTKRYGVKLLEHFPTKWAPVRRKKMRPNKNLERPIRFHRVGRRSSARQPWRPGSAGAHSR